jgi:hypothetical protein
VHALFDVHDTPLRELLIAPAGVGIGWINHREPFQRSTSATPSPALFVTVPTAVQSLSDVHEAPLSELARAPSGSCVLWSLQRAPFQNSANGTRMPAVSIRYPTAVHAPLDEHDTPCSPLAVAPAGIGVGWIDQRRPFQRSANVTRPSADVAKNPTAVHAFGAPQDTAKRCPVGTEGSDTG